MRFSLTLSFVFLLLINRVNFSWGNKIVFSLHENASLALFLQTEFRFSMTHKKKKILTTDTDRVNADFVKVIVPLRYYLVHFVWYRIVSVFMQKSSWCVVCWLKYSGPPHGFEKCIQLEAETKPTPFFSDTFRPLRRRNSTLRWGVAHRQILSNFTVTDLQES